MENIIGHTTICSYLQKSIKGNNLSHAYFFVGPAHVGKKAVAKWFIDAIHPSEELFLPSIPEGEKDAISIDDIRELLSRLSRSTHDGGIRTICISRVDLLNQQAGNALLKCLEEPPKKTLFILCADNEGGVLPTLISRCAVIRFSLVSPAVISDSLEKRGCKDAEYIARLSAGRPGCAVRLMTDTSYRKKAEESDGILRKCETGPIWFRSVFGSHIDSENVLEFAEWYAHARVRECLTGHITDSEQSTAVQFLYSLVRNSVQLRLSPVLQSSKSFNDRLFI